MASFNLSKSKLISGLLLFFLSILVFLSAMFWMERIIILDASFQIFSIIIGEEFAIMFQRYGTILSQFIPLILVKIEAPLQSILVLYSMSFTIYPILLFLTLLVLKQKHLAWIIGLYFLFLMSHTFFWIQSEFIQATMLSILIFGLVSLNFKRFRILFFLIPFFLIIINIYTHPLAILNLLYGTTFLAITEFKSSVEKFWKYILTGLTCLIIFLTKTFYLSIGSYDQQAIGMLKNLPKIKENFFQIMFVHDLSDKFFGIYLAFTLFFIITSVFLLKEQKWLKAILLIFSCAAWIILVSGIWPDGAVDFHFESFLLILGIFLGFPVAYDLIPILKNHWIFLLIILAIGLRIYGIYSIRPTYTDRLNYVKKITKVIQNFQDQRFITNHESLNNDLILNTWGLPYETILLSTLNDPSKPKTILPYRDSIPDYVNKNIKNAIFTGWGPIYYDWMKKNEYFNFTDSTEVKDVSNLIKEVE